MGSVFYLYSFNDNPEYDDYWKQIVTDGVNETLNHIPTDKTVRVLPDTVSEAIQTLPTGKAGGEDNLVYKHLIFSKDIISGILSNTFTHA